MLVIPFTFTIDAATITYKFVRDRIAGNHDGYVFLVMQGGGWRVLRGRGSLHPPGLRKPSVSVIIPAYNEQEALEATVYSIFNQTLRPAKVIVVDDCSTDETPRICGRLQTELGNDFVYVRRKNNCGKASNINYVVREHGGMLGEITLVNDSDTVPAETCIEILATQFNCSRVAAATPYGFTTAPLNRLARALHHGNSWNNRIFKFRKRAQDYRGGISVVCGACTAYRTEVIKRIPMPERTKTEDTDYTWLLQESGYRVVYNEHAVAHSADLKSARSLLRQWYRWYSGILQSLFVHGRNLPRARKLFWTTVLPSLTESLPYAFGVATLPVVAAVNLAMPESDIPVFGKSYLRGFLLADFLLTTVPTAIIAPKYLLRLPQIYLYKYVASVLTLAAYARTTYERATGQQQRWSNVWSRENAASRRRPREDHQRVYDGESRRVRLDRGQLDECRREPLGP